jgi:hypothetical protein
MRCRATAGPEWRVLLIASAGEALDDDERAIFKQLTGREREPLVMVETLLIVAGRRSGKTRAMSVFVTWLATCCEWPLSLGEKGVALFLSPVERQASVAHDYCAALIDHVDLFAAQVVNRTASVIELHSHVELRTEPVNWRHNRGSTAIAVCLDESAFLHSAADAANSDVEIVAALKPSLATTGGPMLLTSSPSAMEGVLFKLWERHHGEKGDPRILVVQADSRTLNPTLKQDVVDRAYAEDADKAGAEYGGSFRQPVSAYLERAQIVPAIDAGVAARTALPGVQYEAFLDVAGGSGQDSFAGCIAHKQLHEGREIFVIDALFEQLPKFNPDDVTARCASLLRQWRVNSVFSDAYASLWPVSAFAKNGITVLRSPLSASEIYQHVIPLWTAGRVRMLDVAKAVDQLCGLRRKVGQGGREIIEHPRGAHDDLANVICGVLWRLSPVEQSVPYSGFVVITESDLAASGVTNDPTRPASIHDGRWSLARSLSRFSGSRCGRLQTIRQHRKLLMSAEHTVTQFRRDVRRTKRDRAAVAATSEPADFAAYFDFAAVETKLVALDREFDFATVAHSAGTISAEELEAARLRLLEATADTIWAIVALEKSKAAA